MTPAELRALADAALTGSSIPSGYLPCTTCGKPHTYKPPPNPRECGSWAADDGHVYRTDETVFLCSLARLLADAMEYVEARHDGMDWANDLLDRFASLGEDTP